ncbi:MAG: HelD family protein, partial [Clostridium sp.]
MTIGLSKEEELKYLDKALLAIDGQLELFGDFKTKKDSEIKSNRRFLWDSMKEMDELEVQSMNEELRMQEKIYINNQKKINTLLAQKNSPYFARIDFKEDGEDYADSLYIGISSIVEDDFDFIALDWRSPISNMFYDYEMGKASYEAPNGIVEGEIILNRQYNIKNSELKFIHDSKSSIHDEALLEVLSNNTSDKMKNIVSSIQREQNSIIRNEDAKILLLQGVAGSGKTSIAMHRAAFLLYKYRKTLKANNVLIFSPNDVFSDYIGDVLPGLGEDNIQTTTLEQYGKMFLPSILKYESKNEYLEWLYKENKSNVDLERLKSIDFKNSFEFIEILDSFTTKLPKLLGSFSSIIFDGKALIPKNKVEETFLVRFKSLPILKRIEALKESLYSQIETKYLLQAKKKNSSDFGYDPIDAGCSIEEYFKINIDEQVNNMFKTLSITKIYE